MHESMRDEKDKTNYNREYDDIDSIARAKTERAVRIREVSVAGLMRMLAHEARFEEPSYDDVVIDPGLVTLAIESPWRDEAIAALRASGASRSKKTAARVQYAIVRLVGADAPEVAEGLVRKGDHRAAVLAALADLPSSPPSLAPLLMRMLAKPFGAVDIRTTRALMIVIMRLPVEEGAPIMLRALGDDELRQAMIESLTREGTSMQVEPNDAFVARFDEAVREIDASRSGGFPSRVALAIASGIATLVKPDVRLARRALAIFDLAPGVLPAAGAPVGIPRETVIAERLLPLCRLLEGCVDELDDEERARLASFSTSNLPERFRPASAAWARLPADRASAIAKGWGANGVELEDQRWSAAARALAQLTVPRPDLVALLPARHAAAAR